MRILMFGWEFPPHLSGGLGTACYGITTALAARGTDVTFVLPRLAEGAGASLPRRLRLRSASGTTLSMMREGIVRFGGTAPEAAARLGVSAEAVAASGPCGVGEGRPADGSGRGRIRIVPIDSPLTPYATEASYAAGTALSEGLFPLPSGPASVSSALPSLRVPSDPGAGPAAVRPTPDHEVRVRSAEREVVTLHGGYGADLMSEVRRYARAALGMLDEDFDVIHVHDWMTYPAGMLLKRVTGKPLVAHIHALECDRTGSSDSEVAAIERAGMDAADVVVAVSHYTAAKVRSVYGIPEDRIRVVHNAVTRKEARRAFDVPDAEGRPPTILFMARITYQKGPGYFVEAARLVLDRFPETRFVMAGSGDMMSGMVRRVAQLRMGNRFHFTGFLRGEEVDRMYAMSDLYVMPSVSEPFGIAPLEAMSYDTPVLISRQSGVSEVVRHALKVDFWDVRDMADKICAVIAYPKLAGELSRACRDELRNIRWEHAADELNGIYARLAAADKQGGI